jgi:hypothetical protein
MCSPVPLLAPLEPLTGVVSGTMLLVSASAVMINTSNSTSSPRLPTAVWSAKSGCFGGWTRCSGSGCYTRRGVRKLTVSRWQADCRGQRTAQDRQGLCWQRRCVSRAFELHAKGRVNTWDGGSQTRGLSRDRGQSMDGQVSGWDGEWIALSRMASLTAVCVANGWSVGNCWGDARAQGRPVLRIGGRFRP